MSKKENLLREQEYQNKFCMSHGLPILRQRTKGPDYYDESCGFLEFVLEGQLEAKDVFDYPQRAKDRTDCRYAVIFLGAKPNAYIVKGLSLLGVRWAFWIAPEYADFKDTVEADEILVSLGFESELRVPQTQENKDT